MKAIMLLFVMGLSGLSLFGQVENSIDSETSKKLTRQQKIEQRRIEEEAMAKLVHQMVQDRQFVLEANYLGNQTGERIVVSSRINFIAVDSNKIVIQLASLSGIGGPNGMGGITAEGSVTGFDVKKLGKAQNVYSIRLFTMTKIGSYDIFFSISPSGYADATISGTTSGKLLYYGRVVPLKQSKVFKAMSI